jgi:hypothetical protein
VLFTPKGGGTPEEICTEGYRLEDGSEVQYIGGKWVDSAKHEYTPVERGTVIGFNLVSL